LGECDGGGGARAEFGEDEFGRDDERERGDSEEWDAADSGSWFWL
jgi:hypothetical protein